MTYEIRKILRSVAGAREGLRVRRREGADTEVAESHLRFLLEALESAATAAGDEAALEEAANVRAFLEGSA